MLTVDSRAYWAAIVRANLLSTCTVYYQLQHSFRLRGLFFTKLLPWRSLIRGGAHLPPKLSLMRVCTYSSLLCEGAHNYLPPSYVRVHIFLPLVRGYTSSSLLCESAHLPSSYVRLHIFLPTSLSLLPIMPSHGHHPAPWKNHPPGIYNWYVWWSHFNQ